MACINHPMIKPESIESREYQLSIAMRALDGNTMILLTCPGKDSGRAIFMPE